MPNRLIKESICTSDNLDQLTSDEERFFYRLMVNCDDYGRFEGRPAILRARLFPLKLDSIKESQIQKWLKALEEANLVYLYESEGLPYIQIIKWDSHQQIRAKKSKFPNPDSNGNQMISSDSICPRNPIQSNPIRNTSDIKRKHGSFQNVKLTDKEFEELGIKFGNDGRRLRIEKLSEYIASKGKKYRSHYATILTWNRKDNGNREENAEEQPYTGR